MFWRGVSSKLCLLTLFEGRSFLFFPFFFFFFFCICLDHFSAGAMAFPEALRCLKLTLPFSDVKELVASGVVCRDLCGATQQSELWEAFRATYTQDKWQTRRGTQVQPPEREDGESAKTYFERIYERYLFFKNQDAVICQRCGTWTSLEEEALECERCVDTWCDECAPRGPSKRSVPCKEPESCRGSRLNMFHPWILMIEHLLLE